MTCIHATSLPWTGRATVLRTGSGAGGSASGAGGAEGATSSEAASARCSRYGEASPRPASVYEASPQ